MPACLGAVGVLEAAAGGEFGIVNIQLALHALNGACQELEVPGREGCCAVFGRHDCLAFLWVGLMNVWCVVYEFWCWYLGFGLEESGLDLGGKKRRIWEK